MPLSDALVEKRPRVVLLDDSRTVLATVRIALEGLGAQVTTATDAAELDVEQLRAACLVVVDVNMEHVCGDDVVLYLRDRWKVASPIYLFSSLPRDELVRRAEAAGATGAVCKGDGVAALLEQVRWTLRDG
jgi:DNA-binding response OmpR family regulator